MTKRANLKGMFFGLMMMLIGAAIGATAVKLVNMPKANELESEMDLSAAIGMLDDSDMPNLIPLMTNSEAIEATNAMLGGQANCQAFISTYCVNDPAFEYRLIQYVQNK